MRKILAALLLVAVLVAIAACGTTDQDDQLSTTTEPTGQIPTTQPQETSPHEHSYSESKVQPTCTQEGYTLHTCQCGDSYKDTIIAATPHTYLETVLEPSCTEDGCKLFTCECGDTYKTDLQKATGHQWGDWQTVKEPTTDVEGKAERKCSRCDQTESRAIDKLIENHTHQYTQKVTTEATCTAEGVKTFACSCGSSYTESIARKAHEYTKQTTEPTCTARGYVTAKCKNCTDSYIENYIKATGHRYQTTVTAPTCTAQGYSTHTCTSCGHSYTDAATNAKDHQMSAATCTSAEKCTVCGAPGKAAAGHKWTEATCTAPKTCSVCKATEGSASAHSYGKWTGISDTQHAHTCADCSYAETKNHNWNAGVVTKKATCRAEGVKTFTCNDCGQTRTETISKTSHKFGNWSKISDTQHQRKCSVCANLETGNHDWDDGKIVQKPTCENIGAITYVCQTCNASRKEKLDALGHNWKIVSEAGLSVTEECTNCKDTRVVEKEVHFHDPSRLTTMTVSEAAGKCSALGNYSLEKYSGLYDVNINICLKCGYADYNSVKSIYTPEQETAKFIALAKSIRDPFLYQDAIEIGCTEEEAAEYVNEYKHVSDKICINYAVRRAKEISVDYSHNGSPVNCAENIVYGVHTIEDDFRSWCNSTGHYYNMVKWAYPYVGYARYIVGDPTFETIIVYSVTVFGYHSR